MILFEMQDGSVESNSLSADSNAEIAYKHSPKGVPVGKSDIFLITFSFSKNIFSHQFFFFVAQSKKLRQRRGSEWEILEGLKDGQRFDKKPAVYTGYLHKKRKWPLKGWHKVKAYQYLSTHGMSISLLLFFSIIVTIPFFLFSEVFPR